MFKTEDPLEKGKAAHSSILDWRIPWTIVHGIAKSRTRLNDFHFASPVIMGHACSVGTGGYTGQSDAVT